MILLDSNVLSALMRLHLEPRVAAWLRQQDQAKLVTSTPSIFEVQYGIERKPDGRQRRALEAAFQYTVTTILGNRILTFDVASATTAGRVRAMQVAKGRTVEVPDSQIAGIALTCGAAVATRNTKDFSGLGLKLIDPWSSP